jgi:hypothetical protein
VKTSNTPGKSGPAMSTSRPVTLIITVIMSVHADPPSPMPNEIHH